MKKIMAITMSLCMIFCFTACDTNEDYDSILIGCILPLSGTSAYDGESAMHGAEAAANYINNNGGVAGGKKIKLIFEDSATDPNTAAAAAEKLINKNDVKIIIGAFNSSCTAAVQPIAEANNIPLITAIATSETLTKNNCKYFFRAVGISTLYIDAFAEKIISDLDIKNIAYIYENGDWGLGSVNTFKKYAESLGAKTTTVQVINKEDNDLYTQLTAIKNSNPDAIYAVANLANAVRIAVQKQELGINCPIIGEGSWTSGDFINQAGSASNDIYGMVEYHPDIKNDMNQLFIELYGDVTGGKSPDKYAACEFNAVLVAANGIDNATNINDPISIKDSLKKIDMNMLTGHIQFDDNGQGYGFEVFLLQNKDDKSECIYSTIVTNNE